MSSCELIHADRFREMLDGLSSVERSCAESDIHELCDIIM